MATHHPDLRVIERELAEIDFSELTALHLIVGIYKNQEKIMADIIALQDAVNKLTQSEVAASNELAVLVSKIGNLSAGTISQDQIDDLAAQVTSVADALTSATNAAQDAVPGDDPAPVEADAPVEPAPAIDESLPVTGAVEPGTQEPDLGTSTAPGGEFGDPVPAPPEQPPSDPVAQDKPVYTVDDGVEVDTDVWPPAGKTTLDGKLLYNYSVDSAGGPANGDGVGGVWHVYEGETQATSTE